MNNKVLSIHNLRGIAALLVVMFHFREFLNGVYAEGNLGQILFGGGAFGVDLFFMISGFIISLSTQRKTTSLNFIVRRFFRIYPVFIIIFIVGALTVYSGNSTKALLRAMFFIHKDYTEPSPSFGYNILGPAWTLTYEIYFYFVFVLAMSLNNKYRTLLASIILLSPVACIQLAYTGTVSFAGDGSPLIPLDTTNYTIMRFISSPILVEFVIGMLLYEIYTKVNFTIRKSTASIFMACCVGLFLSFYFNSKFYGFGFTTFGFWSLILMSGFLVYDKIVGVKSTPMLIYLGDISFSLYMSHFFVMNAFDYYKPGLWMSSLGVSRFILALTVSLVVATLMYRFVEKPFILIGKKIEEYLNLKLHIVVDKNNL